MQYPASTWVEFLDDDGDAYYFHPASDTTQRDKPTDAGIVFLSEQEYLHQGSAAAGASRSARSASPTGSVSSVVTGGPDDWVEYTADDGRRYFYSSSRNDSRWDRPHTSRARALQTGGGGGGGGGGDGADDPTGIEGGVSPSTHAGTAGAAGEAASGTGASSSGVAAAAFGGGGGTGIGTGTGTTFYVSLGAAPAGTSGNGDGGSVGGSGRPRRGSLTGALSSAASESAFQAQMAVASLQERLDASNAALANAHLERDALRLRLREVEEALAAARSAAEKSQRDAEAADRARADAVAKAAALQAKIDIMIRTANASAVAAAAAAASARGAAAGDGTGDGQPPSARSLIDAANRIAGWRADAAAATGEGDEAVGVSGAAAAPGTGGRGKRGGGLMGAMGRSDSTGSGSSSDGAGVGLGGPAGSSAGGGVGVGGVGGSAGPANGVVVSTGITLSQLSFLKSVPLFHSLSEDKLLRLASKLRRVEFSQGAVIIRQGEPPDGFFYIIEGGRVAVHVKSPAAMAAAAAAAAAGGAGGGGKKGPGTPGGAGSTASGSGGRPKSVRSRVSIKSAGTAATTGTAPSASPPSSGGPQTPGGDGSPAFNGRAKRRQSFVLLAGQPAGAAAAAAGAAAAAAGASGDDKGDAATTGGGGDDATTGGGGGAGGGDESVLDLDDEDGEGLEGGEEDEEEAEERRLDLELGPVVAELSKGMFFGERALMTSEKRAATCVAVGKVITYALDKRSFEDVLSQVSDFLGNYNKQNYRAETPETMALARHVHGFRSVLEQANAQRIATTVTAAAAAGGGGVDPPSLPPLRAVMDVMSLFAPEISVPQLTARVRRMIKSMVDAEYVHLLLVDHAADELVFPSLAGLTEARLSALLAAAGGGRPLTADAGSGSSSGGGGGAAASLLLSEDSLSEVPPCLDGKTVDQAKAALAALAGRSVGDGYVRVPVALCGALEQALRGCELVCTHDVTADPRFTHVEGSSPHLHHHPAASGGAGATSGDDDLLAGGGGGGRTVRISKDVTAVAGSWCRQQRLVDRLLGIPDRSRSLVIAPVIGAPLTPATPGGGAAASSSAAAAAAAGVSGEQGVLAVLVVVNKLKSTGSTTAPPPPPPPVAASSSRASTLTSPLLDAPRGVFGERDEDVVQGVADALSLALNDKRIELQSLLLPHDFMPLATLGTPLTLCVQSIVHAPANAASGGSSKASRRQSEAASKAAGGTGGGGGGRDGIPSTGTSASGGSGVSSRRQSTFTGGAAGGAAASGGDVVDGDDDGSAGGGRIPPAVLTSKQVGQVVVHVSLYHGNQEICIAKTDTTPLQLQADGYRAGGRWDQTLSLPLKYSQLPFATRLIFNVCLKDGTPLGWAGCSVFTSQQALVTGKLTLPLWYKPGRDAANRIGPDSITRVTNLVDSHADPGTVPVLTISLQSFAKPVVRLDTSTGGSLGGVPSALAAYTGGASSSASSSSASPLSSSPSSSSSAGAAGGDSTGMGGGGGGSSSATPSPTKAGGLTRMGTSTRLSFSSSAAGAPPNTSSANVDWVALRMTPAEYAGVERRVLAIASMDPLHRMTREEGGLVWRCRDYLVDVPAALRKFLQSVHWEDAASVREAHRLLVRWRPPTPTQALELLQADFADPTVRAYAVTRLEVLPDAELYTFMLQLTQVLKFETFLDSSLTRFLLRRALRSPRVIGHVLFWFLKAEMHIPEVADRFGAILQQYLLNCGDHRTELGHQMFVMAKLEDIASKVKSQDNAKDRLGVLKTELPRIVFPERFQLPLSPHMVAKGLIVDKCRVMSSKKLPLWLVFEAVEADPSEEGAAAAGAASGGAGTASPAATVGGKRTISVLFKAGDDLRQDQLTLQILGVMDTFWRQGGLDLRMSPYRCVSTGDMLGMIEVVLNANTLANIVAESIDSEARGWSRKLRAATQVFSHEYVFKEWLTAQAAADVATVEDNFIRSCAGYCVATYVLGIGDRHNDNLMLTKDGKLFHIDFGHFLGNFKSKFGYKRERAPFIFGPAFAAVMGGEGSDRYKRFEQLACAAYNMLRRHGHLLITCFYLMIASGLPELTEPSDMGWLRDKLMLDATDEEASEHFRAQIKASLTSLTTRINHAFHLIAHVH